MSITAADGLIHHWDPADDHWQESVAMWFFDPALGAGGFIRFGIHPNQSYGRTTVFAFVEGRRRFRRVRGASDNIRVEPRAGEPMRIGSCATGVDADGRLTFEWDEPECSASLVMTEHFYAEHAFRGHGDDALDGVIYGGHLESSGRLRGQLRIDDDERHIDALVHRDRSWGPRNMSVVLTNRMLSGTMGPELSFALNTIGLIDGQVANVGFVVRDGRIEDVQEFVILPSIHLDGYSVETGTALVRLSSGDVIEITCRTVEGFLHPFDDYLCSEHVSVASCGDLVGFCDNELTNNPRLGSALPPHPLHVASTDGLSDCPPRPFREWGAAPR